MCHMRTAIFRLYLSGYGSFGHYPFVERDLAVEPREEQLLRSAIK